MLGAYRVRLWSLDHGAVRLVDRERRAAVAPADITHPLAHAVRTGEPLWLPMSAHAALITEPNEPMCAACVLPLVVEDTVIGAIDFSFSVERRFFPEEREFFLAVAEQVAVAVDRTRLPEITEWPTGSQRHEMAEMADDEPEPDIEIVVSQVEPRRILIVDDDAEVAGELCAALEAMGHEAVVVYNRDAAVCTAHEWSAQYAFIELDSPTTGGYELVAQLCKLPSWERTRFVPLQKPIVLSEIEQLLLR
ncbi:MAG: GAF domain-containing protein [Myxococcota bacterium]|nr:GAF domain-containing protein [Myxococcota bacterium]